MARIPALYMTMIETAEIVAERYDISREAQDEYALRSQQRTAAAQQAGRFDDEIVAAAVGDARRPTATPARNRRRAVTLDKDEGNRPDTNLEGLAALKPVFKDGQRIKEGRFITAGNASQLSDGASAAVLMEESEAERRGLAAARHLSRHRGRRLRPRRDGDRPGLRRAQAVGAARPQDRRHRSCGN